MPRLSERPGDIRQALARHSLRELLRRSSRRRKRLIIIPPNRRERPHNIRQLLRIKCICTLFSQSRDGVEDCIVVNALCFGESPGYVGRLLRRARLHAWSYRLGERLERLTVRVRGETTLC